MEVGVLAVTIAVIVEAVIEYIKSIMKMCAGGNKRQAMAQCAAILIAVALAFATDVDLFKFFGVSFVFKWVGVLLTGVFISRGANYISDFIGNILGDKKSG